MKLFAWYENWDRESVDKQYLQMAFLHLTV